MSQVRSCRGRCPICRDALASRAGVLRGGTGHPALDAKAQARVVLRVAPAARPTRACVRPRLDARSSAKARLRGAVLPIPLRMGTRCAAIQLAAQLVTRDAHSRDDEKYHRRESECRLLDRDAQYVRDDHGRVSRRSSTSRSMHPLLGGGSGALCAHGSRRRAGRTSGRRSCHRSRYSH